MITDPIRPTLLGRRQFLSGTAAGALLLAAGCASGRSASDLFGTPEVTTDQVVRILNWEFYIDEGGTIGDFEASTAFTVNYDEGYGGNEEAFRDRFEPTLGAGRSLDYDIVVPTYWAVARMAERGWLDPLPLELIPNHANVAAPYLGMSWDRGARFHMPWQVGITGIASNPALTDGREIRTIADLLDPELDGRVGMVGEMREVVGLLMLANGDDPARATSTSGHRALDRLEQAVEAGRVAEFTANEFVERLATGDFAAALAWSGDVVQLQAERPDISFVIPEEGGIRWFDSMVIPKGAGNAAGAAAFMDFVYEPANAARITEFVQYISPVVGVRESLEARGGEAAALAANPILFPDDETAARLSFWAGIDVADEDELQARFDDIVAGV